MALSNSIFFEKHGVTTRDLEGYLSEALSRGGDYAELEIAEKIRLLQLSNEAARAYDPRIKQVQASYVDETKHILIATSDGRAAWDLQPLVRLNVMCIAEENRQRQSGYQGGGGRRALDVFTGDLDPGAIARESARQAILQLRAIDAPAGPMEVVLGPG